MCCVSLVFCLKGKQQQQQPDKRKLQNTKNNNNTQNKILNKNENT